MRSKSLCHHPHASEVGIFYIFPFLLHSCNLRVTNLPKLVITLLPHSGCLVCLLYSQATIYKGVNNLIMDEVSISGSVGSWQANRVRRLYNWKKLPTHIYVTEMVLGQDL